MEEFYRKLGLYVDANFLEEDFCAEARISVRDSDQAESPLPEFRLGENLAQRSSARPNVAVSTRSNHLEIVKEKLNQLIPTLNSFFDCDLDSVQKPYFGIYNEGDFMKKHVDVVGTGATNQFGRNRVVSIIIYLNDEDEESFDLNYSGGQLTFHGLLNSPGFEEFGYPIKGEMGKLIAFPSAYLHEVTTVTHGTRYVVSSGYF